MQARFLLGPAGSGKTFRCLEEMRAALAASPEGTPLVLLAPKQATFQLERQLLADAGLSGYTRLQILSFDRLADFILDELAVTPPRLLADEGRLMVLRALLARKHGELRLFRATARLPGFAQQLSLVLREFQRHQIAPQRLFALAEKNTDTPQLGDKLHDLALLLRAYLDWLKEHELQDADHLLDLATEALRKQPPGGTLAGLWLDGFAEMTPQELDLLAALVPHCSRATLAFCLENEPKDDASWLSIWSVVSQTFRRCHQRLDDLSGVEVAVEVLPRHAQGRFGSNPVLAHLERHWTKPRAWEESPTVKPRSRKTKSQKQLELIASADKPIAPAGVNDAARSLSDRLRVVVCANPEAEAVEAAREILRFVRAGGRFRDAAVLVRQLDQYHAPLRRVFNRYQIPFFLDRREPVAHHLLAELTRSALRVVALHWRSQDWFGALKTGLVPAEEAQIDLLENAALAWGWEGSRAWHEPLHVEGVDVQLFEILRQQLTAPFIQLEAALAMNHDSPTGPQLAAALRQFWQQLEIERQLQEWSTAELTDADDPTASPVHLTVWQQMQEWLENLEQAFAHEALPLREWLPILDAGLSQLTVGVIPPALDQVLIGTIDRSRNPDLRLTLLLGMNESVFPAPPSVTQLLTESDRDALENHQVYLGLNLRQRLAHERFYGYIACTRGGGRLVLTLSRNDDAGKALNPSPFIAHLHRLFPALKTEDAPAHSHWLQALHPCELVAPLLAAQREPLPGLTEIGALPIFAEQLRALNHFRIGQAGDQLQPALAERLYGPVLQTSVSRLERFAECPFRFFVHSGLRAEERLKFEFDVRELGSFQHAALQEFHLRLRRENRRWHDLSPQEARARMAAIVEELTPKFRSGLLMSSEQNRFSARSLGIALENFIEIIIGWMPQYEFEPEAVEIKFDTDAPLPPWNLDLGGGHTLAFRGQIDRIDLWRSPDRKTALVVVMDYKSGARKPEPLLMANGVQLQLPAYLNVLHQLPEARTLFQAEELIPVGVFYVNLRARSERRDTRDEALADEGEARKAAYQHAGRFDLMALGKLDNRGAKNGDQFRYRLKNNGEPYANSADVLSEQEFRKLIERTERLLKEMGRRIYAGEVAVDPYRQQSKTPCDHCDYRPVCRIDPWEHQYRSLKESAHE